MILRFWCLDAMQTGNCCEPTGDLAQDPQVALGDMIQAINQLAEITERTGMERPTVIT